MKPWIVRVGDAFFNVDTAVYDRLADDRETIGELAGAVNSLRARQEQTDAEAAELRDELHELATTVRREQDKRLSEAAEPPVWRRIPRYWCGKCERFTDTDCTATDCPMTQIIAATTTETRR